MLVDLGGEWHLSGGPEGMSAPMQIPGDGISALHDAGLIPDPYFGRNEYDLRWICDRDWVISRQFVVDRTDLVFVVSMLDTLAEVVVNGVTVLRAANMFRSFRVDLSGVLRLGSNDIEIRFGNVVAEAARQQAAQPYFVPFSASNTPIHNGNMLRKPSCDFGWDWNIALAPFGVYGDVGLEPVVASRLASVVVDQVHTPGQVVVSVTAEIEGEAEGESVVLTMCGVSAIAVIKRGVARAELVIDNPVLWWPAGSGPQTLHDLVLTYKAQKEHRKCGLREARLITEKDAVGLGFKFAINGRDIFARGANWIPADALAGRITVEATRDLLQSAVDANMNMIRVWGGGRYEPDWFYDLCDELGLMVWQDFMFSCHIYPATEAFLSDVAIEVREQALRLHHHASLVLWCGDNELIGALTWFPETRANRDLYLVGYDRLNRTIEQSLKAAVPKAVWWPSSPSPGPMDFGDAWHDDSKGDMHFWSVWHEGRDFDHYRDVSPRFCSEFGFQSYPSMDVIRKFADPKDWNIASPVMESHQKNAGGNARIAETMFRYFRFPVDFENFVYLSQVQQGLAIKTAVTHWRSLKPHCMGTLIWQLNDTWPVCSWSSLDHGGGWKLLHHMAKAFFQPVLVTAVPGKDALTLVAVNDRLDPVEVSVTAYATQMDGTARMLGSATASVGATAAPLMTLAEGALASDEVLTFGWTGSDGSKAGDIFAPRPWKTYDLPDPGLRVTEARDGPRHVLTVTAAAMAFFVTPEADVPGRWDRAGVHCGPGPEFRFTFTPADPAAAPKFILRDLHSATYGPV